ncbi:MAG: response regulator [Actinomycetota bacterium]|nr:response regulator [Actinomycetota bacterium]
MALRTDLPIGQRLGSGGGGGAGILIVDDRAENLLALEAALEPLQQEIIRAGSGDEALRCLLKKEVAVIILDVQMPGLDGFETAAYIKQLDRTRYIPIIFLTAINKEAEHVFRGYSAGAVDYLFKPFDPTVLRSKVSVFIELHQKNKELQISEERFRRAFHDAPTGVALVALDGSVLRANRALEAMTGKAVTTAGSFSIRELFDPQEPPLELSELSTSNPAGASHAERKLISRDPVQRYVLVTASFIPAAVSLGPHYIVQMTDITDRRELEAFRERFVSHAAHELRTPATVIAGTAALLHESRDRMKPAEIDQCVTALHRQSERLTAMVRNLLDIARLKEGTFKAELDAVELAAVAQQAVDNIPPPEGKDVHLDIADDAVVLADPHGMDHVISNLLVNAYRYGGPTVELEARRQDGKVAVTISDDGAGVPPDLVPKMFEPFTRGKSASSVGGSGLGLALVKSLVEASRGEISYEPGAGGGARFVIRLEAAP